MKWLRKLEPKDGQTRLVTRFLLWPKTMRLEAGKQKETRWLETASWVEEYDQGWDYDIWIERYWSD